MTDVHWEHNVKEIKKKPVSMIHWNGDQVCAIDCETTGTNPSYHEIIQIAVLPLHSDFTIRKDIMPFCVNLKPDFPERIDMEAIGVSRVALPDLINSGIDRIAAIDLLDQWIDKLKLVYTRGYKRKRIRPLGHNYGFDKSFIMQWLGEEQYNEWFSYVEYDSMSSANYINNHCAMNNVKIPFTRVSLSQLCNVFNIDHSGAHDALEDCRMAAEVYRQLCMKGVWVA